MKIFLYLILLAFVLISANLSIVGIADIFDISALIFVFGLFALAFTNR